MAAKSRSSSCRQEECDSPSIIPTQEGSDDDCVLPTPARQSTEQGKWPCLTCTYVNHPDTVACAMCDTTRTSYPSSSAANATESRSNPLNAITRRLTSPDLLSYDVPSPPSVFEPPQKPRQAVAKKSTHPTIWDFGVPAEYPAMPTLQETPATGDSAMMAEKVWADGSKDDANDVTRESVMLNQ